MAASRPLRHTLAATSALLLAIAPAALPAQRPAFSPQRLARIDSFMQSYVDGGRISGAVGLVLRDGKVVYEHAVGLADREAGRRMTVDAIFRIASQTKAITSVAILQLVEQRRIAITDPVSRFMPVFGMTTVAVGSDTGRAIVPATRPITIRDLLTHTSGISYGTSPLVAPFYEAQGLGRAAGWGWYTADKNEPVCRTMERLASLPFVAQPGASWVYGYSIDVLGCIVERASGQPLDEYVLKHITGPLGMRDTYFFLPPAKRRRLAAVYRTDSSGRAERAPNSPRGQGDYIEGSRKNFSGGAGIVSTAADYARFLEAIRRGGALDGVRILSPHAVELMHTNMVGTLHSANGELGFGLGFETVEKYGAKGLISAGSFGWGGAYASMYEVDPSERMVIVFMIQQLPNGTDIATQFPTLVYQALVESARQ